MHSSQARFQGSSVSAQFRESFAAKFREELPFLGAPGFLLRANVRGLRPAGIRALWLASAFLSVQVQIAVAVTNPVGYGRGNWSVDCRVTKWGHGRESRKHRPTDCRKRNACATDLVAGEKPVCGPVANGSPASIRRPGGKGSIFDGSRLR